MDSAIQSSYNRPQGNPEVTEILLLFQVSPVFRSAYDALRALNVYDVEEIRSYRTPPDQVVLVVNAVCLLFGKDET